MSVASQPSRLSSGVRPVDDELDLAALGTALWLNKRAILLAAGLVALFTLVVVQLITPKYFSESRVLIEQHDNVYMRPDADKDINNGTEVDEQAVTSQAQIIMSRDLALEVIKKLKLNELPEFDPALGGISPVRAILGLLGLIRNPMSMTPEERVLESYYDRLTVSPVEKSRVITIDFLSQDPELAARVANAIAEAYLERQRAAKQDQAKTAAGYLSGQIDTLRKRVAEADAKVEAFRAKTNLLVGTNNTTLSAQQLGDFNGQLAATRAQKADAEAKAKMIRDMLRSGQTLESSDILNSELFRRLAEQRVTLRAQLAEQSSTLLDGHPRIKELRAQIADLDHQINDEAARIARSLENDAKLADARMDAQLAALDQLKGQAAATNEQDVQLRSLEMDAKSQRDLLESYLGKYREATARDTLNSAPADARIISRATVSNIPFYPKKLPTVLIATFTTLVLGAGYIVTKELLSGPADVVRARQPRPPAIDGLSWKLGSSLASRFGFGSRPAAEVAAANELEPRMPAAVREPAPKETSHIVNVPISTIEDVAYDLRAAGGAGARVAVFGATPGPEAGRAALRLARLLAEDARVVLVGLGAADAAIKAASDDPYAGGLAELTDGTASFRDIITKDWQTRLHLISSGRVLTDRRTILSAPGMETNLLALARSYDHVVFDAGAASGSNLRDIGEIAPYAILVAGTTANAATAAAREHLFAAGFDDVIVMIGTHAATAAATAAAA